MTRTVADIMTTHLVTFTPEFDIHQAIHVLLDRRLSGAPVVDSTGALVGMLSKKDCLKIAFSTRYHDDHGGQVREYMNSPVHTLDAGMDLTSAALHFLESHYRRFPVLSNGKLVGQVSRADLLEALTESQ